MDPRRCHHCQQEMPATARAHAKYCSTSCRVMAARARKRVGTSPEMQVPARLSRCNRWVRYSADKVPLTASGQAASATDPTTWAPFRAACESTAGTGLGVVLTGDGTVCIDIDHCLTNGQPDANTAAWLATLPPTYIEISPSGKGLHVWGMGPVLTSRKFRRTLARGEVIGARKYVTVTGERFGGAPLTLANIAAQVCDLIY